MVAIATSTRVVCTFIGKQYTCLFIALCIWAALARANMMLSYMESSPKAATMTMEEYEFDPLHYMDLHPDMSSAIKGDQSAAWKQYVSWGRKENHAAPRRFPDQASMDKTDSNLQSFIADMDKRAISLSNRTLVIYFVPQPPFDTSIDAMINSIKVIGTAITLDPPTTSSNFYIFNLFGGSDCVFYRYLPIQQGNVGYFNWDGRPQAILTQLRALDLLRGSRRAKAFGSYFFSDVYTRGPLALLEQGSWLMHYRSLLQSSPSVALAGAALSCDMVPHVLGYAFMAAPSALPVILSPLKEEHRKWRTIARHFAKYYSAIVASNHNISALSHQYLTKEPYFRGNCVLPPEATSYDPTTWCKMPLREVLHLPWHWTMYANLCPDLLREMQAFLIDLQNNHPESALFLPESVVGGILHDLTAQYSLEVLRDVQAHRNERNFPQNIDFDGRPLARDQVCLLVRSSFVNSRERNISFLDQDFFSGFDNFVHCKCLPRCFTYLDSFYPNMTIALLRQTDGNWIAYFFITDHHWLHIVK